MKLIDVIQKTLLKKNKHVSKKHMMDLESRILHDLPINYSSMNNQKKLYVGFSAIKMYSRPVFASAIFLMIIGGVLGFIKFQTTQKKPVSAVKIVSAEEVYAQARKSMGEMFHYQEITTRYCSTDPKDYEQFFRDEGGRFEENAMMRKEMNECIKNNGKIITTSKVWADKTNNRVRLEEDFPEWKLDVGGLDKQGRVRMGVHEPVQIYKDGKIYIFTALVDKNKKGLREGVYIEKEKGDNNYDSIMNSITYSSKTGKEIISKDTNPNTTYSKTELKEKKEGNTEYYVVETYYNFNDPKQKPAFNLAGESWFEKQTFKPSKSIMYYVGPNSTELKVFSEKTYEDFSNSFDEKVFNTNYPPEGYAFVAGQLTAFDVTTNCNYLSADNDCVYGETIPYLIIPKRYKNTEGVELDYPFNVFEGRILTDLNLKVYESKKRFASKEEAQKAEKLEMQELRNVHKHVFVKNAFEYDGVAKVGDEKASIIKVETYDSTGKIKLGELQTIVELPFTKAKFPNNGNLKFQRVTADAYTGKIFEQIYYGWKDRKDITIVFQKSNGEGKDLVSIEEKKQSMCTGYRDQEAINMKNICNVTQDGEIIEATVKDEYTLEDNSNAITWTRTDLIYGKTSVTIQFTSFDKKCEVKNTMYTIYDEATRNICLDKLIPQEEKAKVVKEVKELIKIINKEAK